MLYGGAEDFVGSLIVSSKCVEAVLQEAAEFSDCGSDLAAESGEAGSIGFAGVFGFGGEVAAHVGEGGTNMGVEGLVASIKASELIGELSEARILRPRGGWSAEEQDGEADQNDYLQGEEGSKHFDFPSPRIAPR
jgi:hypothetical protein